MAQQWFVKTKKGQAGPLSSGKLRQLAADGKIKPTTSISPDGRKWVKAQTLKGLFPPPAEESAGPTFGFTEESKLPFVEQREAAYINQFGPYSQVFHELQPIVPHIDVYVHPPHGDRDFTTLVTGGMSDEPMPIPPGPSSPRAELLLYVDEPTEEYVNLLRFLAQIPYNQNTWFSYGSTMTNGQPPQPILEDSLLDCYVFIPSIIQADHDISESVAIEGDPLQLLWVVMITSAERQLWTRFTTCSTNTGIRWSSTRRGNVTSSERSGSGCRAPRLMQSTRHTPVQRCFGPAGRVLFSPFRWGS